MSDYAETGAPAGVEKVTPAFGMWQSIGTAPKDGSYIFAIHAKASVPMIVSWQSKKWCEKDPDDFSGCEDPEEAWVEYWRTHDYTPSHWMPLPPRPGDYLDDRSHASVCVNKDLSAENAELKEALKPFADFKFEMVGVCMDAAPDAAILSVETTDGKVLSELRDENFLRARVLLSSTKGQGA